ncbi:MAG: hypothetical protein ABI237_11015 [Ginsengibacter sp.]
MNKVKVFRNVFGGDDIDFEKKKSVYLNAWGYLVFERIPMLSKKEELID